MLPGRYSLYRISVGNSGLRPGTLYGHFVYVQYGTHCLDTKLSSMVRITQAISMDRIL